jgi:energy-coupling factor transporter ATP-binding protein EcfA2
MYLERLTLRNLRTFIQSELHFLHPDQSVARPKPKLRRQGSPPPPRLPNVNLLVGDNGSGKSTVLQAIALAVLGPAATDSKLPVRHLVRFPSPGVTRDDSSNKAAKLKAQGDAPNSASIEASLRLHEQDGGAGRLVSRLEITRRRDLESIRFRGKTASRWEPVFDNENESFFCACYGATRRIDAGESVERGSKPRSGFLRAERTQSIFQDSFGLYPLAWWLPGLKSSNRGRFVQVINLMNHFLAPAGFRFTGEFKNREFLFQREGSLVPLPSLSDGYRAFIGWISDLLYHVCYGCPRGKKLVESRGIVMVDEIDLHLHPRWQMTVVETVARTLPNMQFILTSHSPLVTGSVEWMNILALKIDETANETEVRRLEQSVHGLDADQILITDFFGLSTTRAGAKVDELEALQRQARQGDAQAARQLIVAMSRGTEAGP